MSEFPPCQLVLTFVFIEYTFYNLDYAVYTKHMNVYLQCFSLGEALKCYTDTAGTEVVRYGQNSLRTYPLLRNCLLIRVYSNIQFIRKRKRNNFNILNKMLQILSRY